MNIHLIRSEEYSPEEFWKVIELLRQYSGPMKFCTDEKELVFDEGSIAEKVIDEKDFYTIKPAEYCLRESPFPTIRPSVKWPDLFKRISLFRTSKDVGKKEFIGLLTSMHNEYNWFSAPNPQGDFDFFIDTGCWDHFVDCDARYPIAYEVGANILRRFIFSDAKNLHEKMHTTTRGCMNDFCEDKKQITLKLRTSDICIECQQQLKKNKVDYRIIEQVLRIFEGIRTHILFRERFATSLQASRLRVTHDKKRLILDDLSSFEVKLTPLEKTIYLFFLGSPEGYNLNELYEHRDKLYSLYMDLSSSANLANIRNSIDDLVDISSNSLSEKISSIKRKFIHSIGVELGEYYIIKGPRGERKSISIDRRLVVMEG